MIVLYNINGTHVYVDLLPARRFPDYLPVASLETSGSSAQIPAIV